MLDEEEKGKGKREADKNYDLLDQFKIFSRCLFIILHVLYAIYLEINPGEKSNNVSTGAS